jgi:GTP-binding protein HflX
MDSTGTAHSFDDETDGRVTDQAIGSDRAGDSPAEPASRATIDRILSRGATSVATGGTWHHERDGDQLDLEDRQALRRVSGLSTELEDVTEVEYRQLRLERVVLAGLWTSGKAEDAENGLR